MTNAAVRPLGYSPFANPSLKWEVAGFIDGVWHNVPFETWAQAKRWLDERKARSIATTY